MPTPQQQDDYDRFVKNGMRLIYSNKKGLPQLLKALDGDGDPVAGLANTVSAITLRLTQSARKAGRPIDPQIALHGAGELMEQLADFSQKTGGHAYQDEQLRTIAQHMTQGMPKPGAPQAAAPPPQPVPQTAAPGPELMPRGGYGS